MNIEREAGDGMDNGRFLKQIEFFFIFSSTADEFSMKQLDKVQKFRWNNKRKLFTQIQLIQLINLHFQSFFRVNH